MALEDRLLCFANDILLAEGSIKDFETFWLARFRQLSKLGRWEEALSVFSELSDEKLTLDTRAIAAHHYVVHLYLQRELTEVELAKAEALSYSTKAALGIRNLSALRGYWHLENNEFLAAKKSLQDAVALARKAGKIDRRSEISLAIAKYNLNELPEPSYIAEQFTYGLDESCHYVLANLWFSIGDYVQAKNHALAAYQWAWADGEPFVRYHELIRVRSFLKKINAPIPELPPYVSTVDEKLSWENDVQVVIDCLHARYL